MAGDGGGEATLPPLESALSLKKGHKEENKNLSNPILPSFPMPPKAHLTHHSGPKLRVSAAIVELSVSKRSEEMGRVKEYGVHSQNTCKDTRDTGLRHNTPG